MSALIPWLTATFGPIGGGIVFVALVILGVLVARFLFWTIVTLTVAVYVYWDTRRLRRENDR